jgi:putative cardiolipin synthase
VFNFHDLDVLGVGTVARQASGIFDLYWNSPWVLAVKDLHVPVTKEQSSAVWRQTVDRLSKSEALSQFPIEPQDWTQAWSSVGKQLQPGTSNVYADIPTEEGIRQEMAGILTRMGAAATRELLIENAYIIPDERFIAVLQKLEDKGVGTRIITNSLASHDVPAVNSHYKQWRKPLLEVTDGLYEMRHDAAIKPVVADTPPTVSQFMGLHSKGMVVDRERVYIGSMNFDPRSADINSEMGVLIESRTLAGQLAELFERDMASANSWHVTLDDKGSIVWVNDRETVKRQPARSYRQRVEDVFFMAFPRDLY